MAKTRINYWKVEDAETGEAPSLPWVEGMWQLQDTGSQAEIKSAFMEIKRRMEAAGWVFTGSWKAKRYHISRGDLGMTWEIICVDEWF